MHYNIKHLCLSVFLIFFLAGCAGGDKNPIASPPYIDNNPPIITNISAAPGRDGTTAVIAWLTNEPSTSEVEYGLSKSYGLITRDVGSLSNPAISHRVNLNKLVSTDQIGGAKRAPAASISTNTDTNKEDENYVTYHYRVKSRDMAGNQSVSPDYTFRTVSLLPPYPRTFIEEGPDNSTTIKMASFRWGATDDITPAKDLLYSYFLEGYDQGYSPYTHTTEKTYTDLPPGKYTMHVRAKDEDGNVDPNHARWSFTIVGDGEFPETTITGGPEGTVTETSVTFNWTGSDNNTSPDNLSYSYFLEGKETGYSSFSSKTTQTYTNLPVGNYTFRVKAKDKDGYEDPTPAARSFTIKEPGGEPETTITGGPSGVLDQTNSAAFTWTGEDDETPVSGLIYAYRLSGYETTYSAFSSKTSASYNNLPRGAYTFYVKAKDGDGLEDPTPAKRSFSVDFTPVVEDTTPPETSITDGPSGTIAAGPQVTFKWSGTDGVTLVANLKYQYMLGGMDNDYSSPTAELLKSYPNLPVGSYTFKVRAVDEAGNKDATPAERAFEIGQVSTTLGMSLKPSKTQIAVGESFTLDVWVNNVNNLLGAALSIKFEEAILEVNSVTLKNKFLGSDIVSLDQEDGTGRHAIAVTQKGGATGKSGSGVLATIEFVGKKSGQSYITIVAGTVELTASTGGKIDTSGMELNTSQPLIRVQ